MLSTMQRLGILLLLSSVPHLTSGEETEPPKPRNIKSIDFCFTRSGNSDLIRAKPLERRQDYRDSRQCLVRCLARDDCRSAVHDSARKICSLYGVTSGAFPALLTPAFRKAYFERNELCNGAQFSKSLLFFKGRREPGIEISLTKAPSTTSTTKAPSTTTAAAEAPSTTTEEPTKATVSLETLLREDAEGSGSSELPHEKNDELPSEEDFDIDPRILAKLEKDLGGHSLFDYDLDPEEFPQLLEPSFKFTEADVLEPELGSPEILEPEVVADERTVRKTPFLEPEVGDKHICPPSKRPVLVRFGDSAPLSEADISVSGASEAECRTLCRDGAFVHPNGSVEDFACGVAVHSAQGCHVYEEQSLPLKRAQGSTAFLTLCLDEAVAEGCGQEPATDGDLRRALRGHVVARLEGLRSLDQCLQACAQHQEEHCRSVLYQRDTGNCALKSEDGSNGELVELADDGNLVFVLNSCPWPLPKVVRKTRLPLVHRDISPEAPHKSFFPQKLSEGLLGTPLSPESLTPAPVPLPINEEMRQIKAVLEELSEERFEPWSKWTPCANLRGRLLSLRLRFCADGSLDCFGEKIQAEPCVKSV